jgi:hypothetical protein
MRTTAALGRHRHPYCTAPFDRDHDRAGSLHPGGQAEACLEPSNQVSSNRHRQQWTPADTEGRPARVKRDAALAVDTATWLRDERSLDL